MFDILLLVRTISFEWQAVLLLLPLPWLIGRFLPAYRPPRRVLRVPQLSQLLQVISGQYSPKALSAPPSGAERICRSMIWILLVVGCAQPYRLGEPVEQINSAREVLLSLDTSGSMDTRDMFEGQHRISRMESVQRVVGRFLSQRDQERFGLAVFGSRAFPYVPFTSDFELLRIKAAELYPGMAGEQTAIGDAIGVAIALFEHSDAEEKVMILLTDGSDTASTLSPELASRLANDAGITIHAIAFGEIDPLRGVAREELIDLEMLEQIASQTDGQVFVGNSHESLEGIFSQLDSLLGHDSEPTVWSPKEYLHYYPVGLAMVLMLTVTGIALIQRSKEA